MEKYERAELRRRQAEILASNQTKSQQSSDPTSFRQRLPELLTEIGGGIGYVLVAFAYLLLVSTTGAVLSSFDTSWIEELPTFVEIPLGILIILLIMFWPLLLVSFIARIFHRVKGD